MRVASVYLVSKLGGSFKKICKKRNKQLFQSIFLAMFKIPGSGVRMSMGSLRDSLTYNSDTYEDMEGIPKENMYENISGHTDTRCSTEQEQTEQTEVLML